MKRMVVLSGLFLLMLSVTVFAPFGSMATAAGDGAKYAGMDSCKECHTKIYDTFKQSGHPYKLNKVVNGKPSTYPFTQVTELPEGVTWDDVSYVIGGYNWKYRFVGKDGFIIRHSLFNIRYSFFKLSRPLESFFYYTPKNSTSHRRKDDQYPLYL